LIIAVQIAEDPANETILTLNPTSMKKLIILLSIILPPSFLYGQGVIFLHHSTGGNVYNQGDVAEYISNYNTQNGTDVQITERAYPNSPYPWNNYAYDYWNLWINSACDNASSGIECLESIASNYDIIIWKHCYPGAGIGDASGEGDITSSSKTIPNYKLQYRALRDKMDALPDNDFIVWTLAPLHRLATSEEQAARAGEFVNWVKNDWLTEDGKTHPNIFIFDFFGIVAEQGASPAQGFQYCLKYDFEGSHESSDSHPNTLANETAGPVFAQYIIDVALGNITEQYSSRLQEVMQAYPNPTSGELHITGLHPSSDIYIYNLLGKKVRTVHDADGQLDISFLDPGIYFLKSEGQVVRIVKE